MRDAEEGCITLVVVVIVFIMGVFLGSALGRNAQQREGIDLGAVTATEGVMTVTGEGWVVVRDGETLLLVTETQGEAVMSTSYLRQWTQVQREVQP